VRILDARPSRCVHIGDSTTDIASAQAVGTAVIAYANKPGKRDRFRPLEPDVSVTTMSALTDAVRMGQQSQRLA
jgi:beta-phosphoglucomutase-like phosphatase (HAD superfamily)